MSAAISLKRIGLGVVAIVAAAIGALALTPQFISADYVREAVKSEIRSVTGLDPVLRGGASVSLFPAAHVSFDDVVLGAGQDGVPALAAERLNAQLRLLPLLIGRIEIADISMVRPRISVVFDTEGHTNWSALIDTLARTLEPGPRKSERLLSFSEIRIADGTLLLRDPARNLTTTLNEVGLSLAWPSISKSFGATGRFKWHDEAVDVSLTFNDLHSVLVGKSSGLKLRVAGTPAQLAFDGQIRYHPRLKIDGTLAADATSLRDALNWVGQEPLPGGGFGRFALKAQAAVTSSNITLSRVNVELDGNAAEGVLTLTTDGRPNVQGTLAANELDLSPYVSTIRLLRQSDRAWNQGPIMLDGLNGFDFDLRLSAAQTVLVGAKVGRSAVAATLREGRMTVTIGESQAFGGIVKGSIALAKTKPGADLSAQLQFSDVDLESSLGELFGVRRLEGKGDLSFDLEGSGASVMALTRTLTGRATLNARQGALAGMNVEQLLRRLERRPLSGGSEFRSGRTPFEKLSVLLKIDQGTATVEDVKLEGSAVRLALDGSASIPARNLDLKGVASLIGTGSKDATAPFELPFVVQGGWDDPIMVPDPHSLIRRSGAAAPLLDALKDRGTRDSVRSAIEHMARPAGAEAPPAAVK